MSSVVYQTSNKVSMVGAGDLPVSKIYGYPTPTSTIGAYPHAVSLVGATERFITILKLELPASIGLDHVLLTLSGEYLITLSGEYLAYV